MPQNKDNRKKSWLVTEKEKLWLEQEAESLLSKAYAAQHSCILNQLPLLGSKQKHEL